MAQPQQAAPDTRAVGQAIDRGVASLRTLALLDEGRHLDAVNQRAGLRALVLYTLLKGGVAPTDPIALDLVYGLSRDSVDQTYDAACTILALEAHDAFAHRAWIEALAQKLVDWQESAGAWSYPGLVIDLSNTQYAALGLWAASKAGVDVASSVWRDLARATFGYQSPDGGFSYTSPPGGSTGSMTAAGVGVLALCELELALLGDLDEALADELGARRARGLQWLADRFAVDTNPGLGGHHLYYLYGLERMGALVGASHIGDHDWYAEGARWLLQAQTEGGSWGPPSDPTDTCFGVLFLERATGRVRNRVPISGPRRPVDATAEEGAAVRALSSVVITRGGEGLAPRARVKTSSDLSRSKLHPDEDYSGEFAVDGNPGTPWLAKPGDTDATLRIQPRGAVEAIGLTIAPPVLPGRPAAPVLRPTRVEVVVNGRNKEALTVDLAAFGRTRVLFPEPLTIKSVELKVLATEALPATAEGSREKPPPTGLGEVGLIAAPTAKRR